MLHLVCASRTPPSSPKPPRSRSNKPRESAAGPTVGQQHACHSFQFISSSSHFLSSYSFPCCNLDLPEGFKLLCILISVLLLILGTVFFLPLVTGPSKFHQSEWTGVCSRDQWWDEAAGWISSLSPAVFTVYAEVSLDGETLTARQVTQYWNCSCCCLCTKPNKVNFL